MERGIAATAQNVASPVWSFLLDLRAPSAVERRRVTEWVREPETALNLTLVVVLIGLWGFAFYPTLAALVDRWASDENYSHGFLTPIVSLYLAIQNFKARPIEGRPRGGVVLGGLVILLGMSAGCVTVLFPSLLAECVAMLSVLAGGILLLGGREWWSRLQTPTLFLLFAVPWPSALYSRIAFPLQQFVCQAAAFVLELAGVAVLREGNVIHLPRQSSRVHHWSTTASQCLSTSSPERTRSARISAAASRLIL